MKSYSKKPRQAAHKAIWRRLGLEKGKYILLSAHREENIDTEKNFISLFTAINKMAEKYDLPILYSCHPRSRKRLEASDFKLDKRVIRHEPLGFHDYNCLQMNAFCVVSDSGTLPEESSFFTSIGKPFPAVCIRTSTERPEALDKACFILSGIDGKGLLQAALGMDETNAQTAFDDAIGLSGDDTFTRGAFQIPYRTLLPSGVENLLVAGRAIGVAPNVIDRVRLIPVCMVTGEAAGTNAIIHGKIYTVHLLTYAL